MFYYQLPPFNPTLVHWKLLEKKLITEEEAEDIFQSYTSSLETLLQLIMDYVLHVWEPFNPTLVHWKLETLKLEGW